MNLSYAVCPVGWIEALPGRCYKFFGKKRTFSNAQKSCASFGARLALASTFAEQKALEVVL